MKESIREKREKEWEISERVRKHGRLLTLGNKGLWKGRWAGCWGNWVTGTEEHT